MAIRTHKCKLYCTPDQEQQFQQIAGTCRAIYNAALEQRSHFYRQFKKTTGKQLNYVSQAKELTALRAEIDWCASGPQAAQQQVLRDLEGAFTRFFKGINGYPSPRRKGINDSFRFPGRYINIKKLNAKWSHIEIPKVGWVKMRVSATVPDEAILKEVTIKLDALGWHVCVCYGFEPAEVINVSPMLMRGSVGIDRGIVNNVATSNGELMSLDLSDLEAAHRNAQRVVSRRIGGRGVKSSKRRIKAIRHAARVAAKVSRKRRHWQHVVTRQIVNQNRIVVIEALKIGNMMRSAKGTIEEPGKNVKAKSGLNRSIAGAAWYQFETLLTYKLAETGGELIKVNPAYTSQKCVKCENIDKANRENQAKFACTKCGHEDHADINAAANILKAGTQPATSKVAKRRAA